MATFCASGCVHCGNIGPARPKGFHVKSGPGVVGARATSSVFTSGYCPSSWQTNTAADAPSRSPTRHEEDIEVGLPPNLTGLSWMTPHALGLRRLLKPRPQPEHAAYTLEIMSRAVARLLCYHRSLSSSTTRFGPGDGHASAAVAAKDGGTPTRTN